MLRLNYGCDKRVRYCALIFEADIVPSCNEISVRDSLLQPKMWTSRCFYISNLSDNPKRERETAVRRGRPLDNKI